MSRSIFIILISLTLLGCSKMQEKKVTDESKTTPPQTPMTGKTEDKSQAESKSSKDSKETDEKAVELSKSADDAVSAFTSDKNDDNRKSMIVKCMAAGNYLTFEASLPAREKYRPALKYYRKVLEVDPKNEEAEKNKKQIEDIYIQMGMPIPQ